MDAQNVFPKRLRNARVMRGLSAQELCDKAGGVVTRQAVSKYEKGQCMPDSRVLLALCEALAVKPDYLFRPFGCKIGDIHYRKLSKLNKGDLKLINMVVEDEVERLLEAEMLCAVECSFKSVLKEYQIESADDVAEAAARLRQDWDIGNDAIRSVTDMLENNGVLVVEVDAPKGFSGLNGTLDSGRPVIVVNKNMAVERKRLTALHELGHALLQFGKGVDEKMQEGLCNAFANEVLIPREVLIKLLGSRRHDIAVVELRNLQQEYGISIDALMYKAKSVGVISSNRYEVFCKKKNSNWELRAAIEQSVYKDEHSSKRLENLVYKALADDIISTSKAAELLNVEVEEVLGEFVLA